LVEKTIKKRSPLWYELPILFAILGGIIAYFKIKGDDKVKARRCIIIGVVYTVPLILLIVWILFLGSDTAYVIASESMIPELLVYDVAIVDKNFSFDDVEIGNIIVFNRPSDHDRVILHRVVSIIDDNPTTLRTKGDANPGSIPGTDSPITKEEYIGKVEYVLPQIGLVTQILLPPINYIINMIHIGIFILPIILHMKFRRNSNQN
jgi:signal peptidase